MRIKALLTAAVIVSAAGQTYAQYAGDAVMFSQTQFGSTARFKAIGAQTGIGGDLSSVGANPAGIGLFTRSEFSLTPEFNGFSAESRYLNDLSTSRKDQLNLAHAAVVWNNTITKPKGAKLDQGLLSFNFGLSYNRTAALGNLINYSGVNGQNSIADYYAELATDNYGAPGTLPAGTLERMAYDNYLIGYDPSGYYFPETDVNNKQSQSLDRRGSLSEINFAVGGNFSNTFYIGASIGLANVNYSSFGDYREEGFNVTENANYVSNYRQSQSTKGSGFNAKIGAIFKPAPNVRIGAAFQTPTWYSIDDSYGEALNTRYSTPVDGSTDYNNPEEIYDFTYRLRTPMKLSGGIGIFFNNAGFISADVDYIDYSQINFSAFENTNTDVINSNNRDVINNYKSAVNFRVGGEYKIDNLALRVGYGMQGHPYKNMSDNSLNTVSVSGGLGYRVRNYYIDLTWQNLSNDALLRPYRLSDGSGPAASVTNTRNNVFLTVGTRF